MEQQSEELSVCLSQLQRSRQSEQQSWFAGGLRFGVSTPNLSERVEEIRPGVHQGVQSAPVTEMALSENKPEPDGLVGSPKTRPVHKVYRVLA